jgi:hypothetical protein
MESLEPVVEIREHARADDGWGSHIDPVEELTSPLFNESRNDRAGKTEAQCDEPKRIAYDRRLLWNERARWKNVERGPVCRGCELLRDS